ncbi:hypothetical protein [Candidatus Magnetominusculus xianensis]|uniref:hypothetical protein n=1 Tax=Candidatus Magnetominusculus xianensis TaxID=1748249 RepID=UPI000A1020DF|nr:hypothetical protein [Candidatus Magnetominusculus xianensis]MBF0403300.1 hypothetical protein [Nitrospirota bacterium]
MKCLKSCCWRHIENNTGNLLTAHVNTLLIYDSYSGKLGSIVKADKVFLFSLTSKKHVSDSYIRLLQAIGCTFEIIDSSKAINESALSMRDMYIRLIAKLPVKVKNKGSDLKEIFAVGQHASLWWFSLVAEKNTHKSDTLTRLSQLDAITEAIKRYNINKIIITCSSSRLKSALTGYASEKNILIDNSNKHHNNTAAKAKSIIKQITGILYYFIYSLYTSMTMKREFASVQREPVDDNALMLLTYYPNIDIAQAKKGIFADKNYMKLQTMLTAAGSAITWIALYVESNAITKEEAIRSAKTFIKNGSRIYFLDEFNSLWTHLSSLVTMFFSALKFILLEKNIKAAHVIKDYNMYALVKDDWYSSFMGIAGYQGLVYYKTFKRLLSTIKARKYLYLLEHQAWEKAFISAKKALGLTPPVLGSQSGTVSQMLLNFFNDPSEIRDTGRYSLPKPDIIICNGQHPYSFMLGSGWPQEKLYIAEAVRYSYLIKYLEAEFIRTEKIVLLACSISIYESSSMLNVLYEALNNEPGIEVWIKPHPFLQIEKLFQYSGIEMKSCSFKIINEPIGTLLQRARVVVVGESSVCIEAIAFGCDVFIVNSPEWISMSPLTKTRASMINTVSSADELKRQAVRIFMEQHDTLRHRTEAKRIINEFFYFSEPVDSVQRFFDLVNK